MRTESAGIEETTDEDSDVTTTEPSRPLPPTTKETLNAFYEEWKREVSLKKQNEFSSKPKSHSTCALMTHDEPGLSNDHYDQVVHNDAVNVSVLNYSSATIYASPEPLSVVPEDSLPDKVDPFSTAVIQHDSEQQTRTHISELPRELLLRIFRWAVGDHLDTRILGKLACVCRVFHSLAYEPFLWRAICLRQWPLLARMCAVPSTKEERKSWIVPQYFGYPSWREMAIRKPHILFDGCYLCRISYVRMGEPTFTDYYRPVHLVVYYRGIRFHTDGRVEMLTSASEPTEIVNFLGKACKGAVHTDTDERTIGQGDSESGLLLGRYVWEEPNVIICTLRRPVRLEKTQPMRRHRYHPRPVSVPPEVIFTIRFRLTSSKRRLHNVLTWESYVIDRANNLLQTRSSTQLDVSSSKFPPCYYSRVRSYTRQVSTEPV